MSREWVSAELLSEHPGRITCLLDQEFEVVKPWSDYGFSGINGRPVLLRWQVGVKGVFCAVHYSNRQGWRVLVEYRGEMAGMEADEVWPEIPLQSFLSCCAPLVCTDLHDLGKEAANDD